MFDTLPYTRELVSFFDVVVDGRFVEELKDISLKFRGSSNQRLIDVRASLTENKIVLYTE
jgi:anaerobic ribonucleoside-triphosphate reductase activating protein